MGIADAFLERHPDLLDLDLTSEGTLRRVSTLATPLAWYFRFSVHDWEQVPSEPCIIVANHSIGSPFVLPLLARAWTGHFGVKRPVRGMMHRVAWQWPFRQLGLLQRMGGIYAHPTVAKRALAAGKSLLVFPGGDLDAMRPFGERYRVDFAGRSGFARLARETGAKVVPLVICGSHATYIALPGARRLARLIALERWTGLKGFPLTLGAAALVATLATPALWSMAPLVATLAATPLPTRIEARFLSPMSVDANETDADAAERVRGSMEQALFVLAAKRSTFLG